MLYVISILTGALGALGSWAAAAMITAGVGTSSSVAAFGITGPFAAAMGFVGAIALTFYIKGDVRTLRGVAVRSLNVVLMIGALAAGVFSLRTAALTHLGVIAKAPAVEFEIRLPPAVARTDLKRDAQVELLTDLNQTLAQLDGNLRATEDGRAVLRGHVPLKFRTSERMVVLSLPGQAQRAFKLRLPPNPSPSDEFGPWHMVDRVVPGTPTETARGMPDDTFAIRYRVL
jgi:hypothetical protein